MSHFFFSSDPGALIIWEREPFTIYRNTIAEFLISFESDRKLYVIEVHGEKLIQLDYLGSLWP